MLRDQSKDYTFMASLLYYFGVLSLEGQTEPSAPAQPQSTTTALLALPARPRQAQGGSGRWG
jgi:hypothetical protein